MHVVNAGAPHHSFQASTHSSFTDVWQTLHPHRESACMHPIGSAHVPHAFALPKVLVALSLTLTPLPPILTFVWLPWPLALPCCSPSSGARHRHLPLVACA